MSPSGCHILKGTRIEIAPNLVILKVLIYVTYTDLPFLRPILLLRFKQL